MEFTKEADLYFTSLGYRLVDKCYIKNTPAGTEVYARNLDDFDDFMYIHFESDRIGTFARNSRQVSIYLVYDYHNCHEYTLAQGLSVHRPAIADEFSLRFLIVGERI